MEEIVDFLGKVLAYGGGSAAIAYLTFQFLGRKWIETKFAERLESYKHARERELAQYRNQVSILLSRVTKIHEKEIEVLPEIWHKLQVALGYVAKITSPMHYGPNFNFMNSEELQEFLKNPISTIHIKEMLENTPSKDRNTFYTNTIFWYDLSDAKSAVSEFHNYFLLTEYSLARI